MVLNTRYGLADLQRAIRNPRLVQGELRRIGTTVNSQYHRRKWDDSTTAVLEEDWDNLIILDACRHDAYTDVTSETVDYRISNATESWDFMSKNFAGKELHDTIYITANPFATRLDHGTFFAIKHLIESDWNEELGTVLPGDVVDAAVEMFDTYPNKKYIIHFMQPHYPFIGSSGEKIDHTGYNRTQEDRESGAPNIWWVLQYGYQDHDGVTEQKVWEAYEENLEIVRNHVTDLLENIPGKSVITADHGTMIGDRIFPVPVRGYGHAHGAFVPPVVKVPWDVYQTGDRREIFEETPVQSGDVSDTTVADRLTLLGYKQ